MNRICDKISTEIEINAPQSTVWQTLTDFQSYADWNPFILKATADFAVGSTIEFAEEIPERGQFNIKAIWEHVTFAALTLNPSPKLGRGTLSLDSPSPKFGSRP